MEASSLDRIMLSILLFSDTVYINAAYNATDTDIACRLIDLHEAGFVTPWLFPSQQEVAPWAKRLPARAIEHDDYGAYADLVQATIEERSTRASGSLRVADLADLSTHLWCECVCAALGATQVLGDRGRSQHVLDARGATRDIAAVTEFLKTVQVDGSLNLLSIADVVALRSRHRAAISKLMETLTAKMPVSSNISDGEIEKATLKRLIEEYESEVREVVRRARPSGEATAVGVGLDVTGFFVAPVGFFSIFSRIGSHAAARRRAPLVWLVADLQRSISANRGTL